MRSIILLVLVSLVCCETFYFGSSFFTEYPFDEISFEILPKDISVDIDIIEDDIDITLVNYSSILEDSIEFRLLINGDTHALQRTLESLSSSIYILIEKQSAGVDNYDIPAVPYSFLQEVIEWNDIHSPIEIKLKQKGIYKITIDCFNFSKIGITDKQAKRIIGFPTKTIFTNFGIEKTKSFTDSLNLKREEKNGEQTKLSTVYSTMSNLYKNNRLYPELFEFKESFLSDSFLSYIKGDIELNEFLQPISDSGVYQLDVFQLSFCEKLIEEVDNYENFLVKNNINPNEHRPNFLNKYGVILDEMGFGDFLDSLTNLISKHLGSKLYPEWNGDKLDSHHGFIVEYQLGNKDIDLEYHMDQAEITLNVCLGKEFEGGDVYFHGIRDHWSTKLENQENINFHHSPGTALIHIGQHWHGANKIISGERYNLILWMRSSKYHQSFEEQFRELFSKNNILSINNDFV